MEIKRTGDPEITIEHTDSDKTLAIEADPREDIEVGAEDREDIEVEVVRHDIVIEGV